MAPRNGLPPYSALMAVYEGDQAPWVEEAVASLAGQSWPPREIVIVEDGPLPAAIREVLSAWESRLPGVLRFLPGRERQGLAEAMKRGIEACRCEWIARMDADDLCAPRRCEKELRSALAHGADLVGCDCAEFTESPDKPVSLRVFPETHEELVRFSRRKTPFCHPAVMMKKSAVLKAGNYRAVRFLEDYDLFVRMFSSGAKGYTVKETLHYVRVGKDFYSRRGGWAYVKTLMAYNVSLLKEGWTRPSDFLVRSCGNILVGLAPCGLRAWMYRRLLRK